MGVDSHPTAHAAQTTAPTPRMEGVFSTEEFERDFQAQQAANKAAKPAPGPKSVLAPVALGSRSSKHTQGLHMKYQKLGIPQPVFSFEGSSSQGWKGEVSFPGLHEDLQGIKDDKIYSNKQHAKEELSGRALEILDRLEKAGIVLKVDSRVARVSKYTVAVHDKAQRLGIQQPFYSFDGSNAGGWRAQVSFLTLDEIQDLKDETYYATKVEAKEAISKQVLEVIEAAEAKGILQTAGKAKGPAQQAPKGKEESGVNYVGQLLEFQRATNAPQPTYEDYSVGSQFTCIIQIAGTGSFGSLDARYTSKKTARREAARAAVEHLQSTGAWPQDYSDLGGIKKKAKLAALPSDVPELLTPRDSPDSRSPSIASTTAVSASYPQQVARLGLMLSLSTPEWRFTPSAMDPNFHTVQCFFAGGGEHAGPIGEVRNVFGKKKAKEECARLTLEYLTEVYRSRIAFGQSMMAGIGGGERMLEGAVARPRDEGGEVKGRDVGERGEESDDEAEFEDAVDVLSA